MAPHSCTFDLVLDASAPATARAVLCSLLTQWQGPGAATDTAALVLTELVTNALQHAPDAGPVTVGAELDATGLRLWVGDRSSVQPREEDAAPDAERGRGLAIVARLGSWTSEPWLGGKRVVVELAPDEEQCA